MGDAAEKGDMNGAVTERGESGRRVGSDNQEDGHVGDTRRYNYCNGGFSSTAAAAAAAAVAVAVATGEDKPPPPSKTARLNGEAAKNAGGGYGWTGAPPGEASGRECESTQQATEGTEDAGGGGCGGGGGGGGGSGGGGGGGRAGGGGGGGRAGGTEEEEVEGGTFSASGKDDTDARKQARMKGLRASLRKRREGDQMPIKDFEFWYEVIEQDDEQLAEQLLSRGHGGQEGAGVGKEERAALLNGRFVYDCRPHKARSHRDLVHLPCAYQRPLVLAAVFRSTAVLRLFLRHAADLFVQDLGGSTVIHGLVQAAAQRPGAQPTYVHIYEFLMRGLSGSQKRRLLLLEDAEGLRPLELAARLRTFLLLQSIFNTEDVYLFRRGLLGAHLCTWYDVTDYEGWQDGRGRRRHLSPLRMLTLLEKEFLPHAKQSGLVAHPAMSKWMATKVRVNVPYVAGWFLVRIVYTALIFVSAVVDVPREQAPSQPSSYTGSAPSSSAGEENRSAGVGVTSGSDRRCPRPLLTLAPVTISALTVLVVSFSAVILVFDIVEAILYRLRTRTSDRRCYHVSSSRNFVVRTRFYRMCNFLLATSVIAFHTARLLDPDPESVVTSKVYMVAIILNIWSLLFFIQLLPALGYFVTIIQRMLKDMFHFLILYVILFFSFSQAFFNLFYIRQVCSEHFTDMLWSMYSTFRVMLNMVELTDGFRNPGDVAILHTTYVIVVPILLVNFLIALMSNSVSDVAENRLEIMLLQRLSVSILVEGRLGRVIPWLYKIQQDEHYVNTQDRTYVECFVFKQRND